ncbi:FeoA family protein [Dialister sp.]|jgi:ferrous iron transport protein A|uniref:FeoA family protein n=2 Tax=Dialister TaxID=39948 RepID=UPI0025DBE54B|nr:FeoA family protein [Dialister sp.]
MKGNGVKQMMPLIFAKEGDTVTIRRISGKEDIRQHLAELGFVVDTPVLIVSHMAGNLIVQVKGSRVALDRSMAQKIYF